MVNVPQGETWSTKQEKGLSDRGKQVLNGHIEGDTDVSAQSQDGLTLVRE